MKMGRTEPTIVKPPAAFRRDARAKRARATINKVIPALLTAHPRARRGIERSELIVDPPPVSQNETGGDQGKKKVAGKHASADGEEAAREGPGKKGSARRRKRGDVSDEQPQSRDEKTRVRRKSSTTHQERGPRDMNVDGPRLTLYVGDTLTAAHSLLFPGTPPADGPSSHAQPKQGKVGILNMASPLSPGGGFLNGATSQEESLCMRTTLLPALRDEFYRLPELGVVYTPDVLVFRPPSISSSSSGGASETSPATTTTTTEETDDVLPKTDRWFVDVASAAMLRLPETEEGRYVSGADRELAARKMRAVLRVFAAGGCSRVVLGAWGCGAYGNPVAEIAGAWRRVLCPGQKGDVSSMSTTAGDGDTGIARGEGGSREKRKSRGRDSENWGAFLDEIVFAIKDAGMAAAFARAFGEDLLPLPTPLPGHGARGSVSSMTGDGEDDPVEAARIGELREKIAQLEIQVEQAQSSHLKVGLEAVLGRLRKELPFEDDGEASSGSEREHSSTLDGAEEEEAEEAAN
ncbi:hypothetical protein GGS24DRAFT_53608 [Hypoxylon argillaceum]|nr:hypothetical protein GGS24DRAFT_53608 [Hypoxylon argillaceum]